MKAPFQASILRHPQKKHGGIAQVNWLSEQREQLLICMAAVI